MQLPHRQDVDLPIAHHPDVEFAPFDVLLDEGAGPDARVDEGDALLEFVVLLDNGRLRDPERGLFGHRFDNEGKGQPRGPLDRPPLRHHHEIRERDAMEREELLGEDFVARQHQPPRVTAGIGHVQQFQIRHDVLVVDRHPIELFEQIEGDVRLPVFDGRAQHAEIALDPQRRDVMAELAERGDHIVFRLPLGAGHVLPGEGLGRHQIFVHQDEDA